MTNESSKLWPWVFNGARLLVKAGGVLAGVAVLWWVATRVNTGGVEVVVHVQEPDVEVTIDAWSVVIEGARYDPIVRELSPGWHVLVMKRGDHVLFAEMFEVRRSQNVVLTAYDASRMEIEPTDPNGFDARHLKFAGYP